MTPPELVTPLFLFAAALHRRIKRKMPPDFGEAKREAMSLFSAADAQAAAKSMTDRWNRAKVPIAYLIDEIAIMDDWPGRDTWNNHSLEVEYLGHHEPMRGEWFYQQDYADALRRDDVELIEILYICMCLGFEGQLRKQTVELQQHIDNLYSRMNSPFRGADSETKLFPECYVVDKSQRDAKAPMRVWTAAAVFLTLIVSYFVINQVVYHYSVEELADIAQAMRPK